MTLFADILLLALSIVAPLDGATVPTLRGVHKAYLQAPRAERFKVLENVELRKTLVAKGGVQQPLRLAWAGEADRLYELMVEREGGESQTFTIPRKTEAYITNLEIGARYRWSVSEPGTTNRVEATFLTEEVGPRLLRADGVLNLRDLGGWKGLNGRRVRQNKVFRSAGLRYSSRRRGGGLFGGSFEEGGNRITPQGIQTLRDDLAICTDIELRNNQEAAGMTSSILGESVSWIHVPFAAYDFIDSPVRGREPFAAVFKAFLDPARYPILFHCSGGRDRTGTLAFLLNGLLGVSDEDLCRDWETSVFVEENVNFGPSRLQRILGYLRGMGGKTMAEQCERYVMSCGVTKEEIEKFRGIMLEGGN